MANGKTYKSAYSGPEIDAAIGKINSLDISNYYDKAEIDEKLANIPQGEERFDDDAKPAEVAVGNIKVGQKLAGLSLKTILKMMLYGEGEYPTLIAPTFNVILSTQGCGVAGSKYLIEGELSFDRGQITPAYGTSGFRSGLPYKYEIVDKQIEISEIRCSFSYDFTQLLPGENKISFKVFYDKGEQPLDSTGAPYDSALPAGEIESILKIVGLSASFSGLNDEITEDDFPNVLIPIDDKNYEQTGLFGDGTICGYQVVTPDIRTAEDQQILLIPDSVELFGIQSWDILINNWSWYYGKTASETLTSNSWIKTDEIISKNINGVSVHYRKYKYNLEEYGAMNKNYFRFFIKEVK